MSLSFFPNSARGFFDRSHPEIQEDAPLAKAVSCIPFLGIIPFFLQEMSLAEKLERELVPERVISLLEVKNHYKIANVIRHLLTLALCITGVALNIIEKRMFGNIPSVPLFSVVFGCAIISSVRLIKQNERAMERIKESKECYGVRFV